MVDTVLARSVHEASAARADRPLPLAVLYGVTSFVGAGLLFLVQPMITHQVLPLFGGSAMVWNTATMFFQLALLTGYAVTHLTVSRFGVRRHVRFQSVLVLLPLTTLPIGLSDGAAPGSGTPALHLVLLLAAAVGAPFLVLSTGGPLLQRWFAASRHPRARDPYFLFAAGNAGSFLALVGYPLLVAPHQSVRDQLRTWSLGYVAWTALVVACAVAVRRPEADPVRTAVVRAPVRQEVRWVALAALASSLMLGTTTYLTTDLAPVPLLWVLPLGLYLLTFVVTFGWSTARAARLAPRLARSVPVVLLPCLLLSVVPGATLAVRLPAYLALFTVVAAAAHARLSAERPAVEGLTRFYLLVALGGAIGGVANGLVAPIAFNRMYEFPLALVASLLLLPRRQGRSWLTERYGFLGGLLALLLGLATIGATPALLREAVHRAHLGQVTAVTLAAVAALAVRSRPRLLAVGCAVVTLVPLATAPTLAATRSYFGVATVLGSRNRHELSHGTTVHGWQDLRPARRRLAQSYYEAHGPIGQLLTRRSAVLAHGRLGVVGLGTGTLAAYGQPGEQIRFFEIDPQIVRLARDDRLFSYLRDSPARVQITLGDGRLSLADQPAHSFDVLVLDAFTSDAVPVHLLTREAVHLFVSRLRPGGVVAFHVSNRYLNLQRVLADVAASEGLVGLAQNHPGDVPAGGLPSQWVVLAAHAADLKDLRADPRWVPLEHFVSGHRAWTDDYSDLLGALR